MDTLQKAKELGKLITQSEEAKALKKSEALVEEDEKGKALMDDYKKLKESIHPELKRNGFEGMNKALDKVAKKEEEMNEYDVTKHYLDCKKEFEGLNKKIDELILHCQEAEVLQESETLAKQDEKGAALVEEYDKIQSDLFLAKVVERKTDEEIEQLEKKLEQNKAEINEYHVTRKYFEDKDSFNYTIREIDRVIRQEIESRGFCYTPIGLFRFWKI